MKKQNKLAIVGIGNELCKDDGFGVLALRKLKEKHIGLDTLLEGGTYGISLLPLFFEYDYIIFLDVIKLNDLPGSIYVIPLQEIASKQFLAVSFHDVGVIEVYNQSRMLGAKSVCYLVGIVPFDFDGYGEVSEVLKSRMDDYLNEVIKLACKISSSLK